MSEESKRVIGWREWLSLPELGVARIKAKIDTGARTSALHAFSIEEFRVDGSDWVRFQLHPHQYDTETVVTCEAEVIDRRDVTDSGGHTESRYVIKTAVTLGGETALIEMTLTSRDNMRFRMLLGRTAMSGLYIVDPEKSYLLSK